MKKVFVIVVIIILAVLAALFSIKIESSYLNNDGAEILTGGFPFVYLTDCSSPGNYLSWFEDCFDFVLFFLNCVVYFVFFGGIFYISKKVVHRFHKS